MLSRKHAFSFSGKRAIGLSAAKARLSRQIGIPLTRYGRQRKVGRAMGCMVVVAVAAIAHLCLASHIVTAGALRIHG